MQLMKRLSSFLFLLALFVGHAAAQMVQNQDFFVLVDASLPTTLTSTRVSFGYGYGYQIVRTSGASLWAELSVALGGGSTTVPGAGGKPNLFWNAYAPGLRFMVPLHERVSIYAASGGGAGRFRQLVISGTPPFASATETWHGVFDVAGGLDIRLKRSISLRAEFRDFVTGRQLSGADGRHHPVAGIGIGFHR
jgi:hypothetical protein